MEEFATRKDLNGLGQRVNSLEGLIPRVKRSEEDIQKIFANIGEDQKDHVSIRQEISLLGVEIQKSINGLVMKALIGISVPTVLVLVQLLISLKK